MSKSYLGDGVYVDRTPSGDILLTAENGIEATNTIVLEQPVWQALIRWVMAGGRSGGAQ